MLTITRHPGEGFFIDGVQWRVERLDDYAVVLRRPAETLADVRADIWVVREEGVELEPRVFVSRGVDEDFGTCKLVFSAPRSIRILRSELYYEEQRRDAAAKLSGTDTGAAA